MTNQRKVDLTSNPLVSVVTVVYNGEKFLEQTINSVLCQSYKNLEYIIIDGGSTDKTLQIIQKHSKNITHWISEPDDGIYSAMNKGISMATGEIVGIINSDDFYAKDAIIRVVNAFKSSNADIVFGSKVALNESFQIVKTVAVPTPKKINQFAVHKVHPTVFVKRDIYHKYKFNESYRIASDYDLLLSLFAANYRFHKIDRVLVTMRVGGASGKFHIEGVKIRYHHIGLLSALIHGIFVFPKKFLRLFFHSLLPSPLLREFYLRYAWSKI